MSSEIHIAGISVPQADWDATPESIQALILVLSDRLSHIEEQLHQNSQNSSRPPSSDSPETKAPSESQPSPPSSLGSVVTIAKATAGCSRCC